MRGHPDGLSVGMWGGNKNPLHPPSVRNQSPSPQPRARASQGHGVADGGCNRRRRLIGQMGGDPSGCAGLSPAHTWTGERVDTLSGSDGRVNGDKPNCKRDAI